MSDHFYQKKITDEQIDDLLVTAFEGGITYWCGEVKVVGDFLGGYASEQISRGGVLKLYDAEEEKWHTLNMSRLLKGLSLSNIDLEDYDAGDADTVIQNALFGEVVYG